MSTPPELPIVPGPDEPTHAADVKPSAPAPRPRASNRGVIFGSAFAVFSLLFMATGGAVLVATADTTQGTTTVAGAPAATSPSPPAATSTPPPPAATTAPPSPPPARKPAAPHKAITDRQWLLIAKDPDAHAGERIVVHGLVTQFDAATGSDTFRGDVGGKKRSPSYGYVDYETNTILNSDATKLAKVVEDDLFTAKVTVLGSFDYETQVGGGTTAPLLQIDSITVTGSLS